MALPVLKYSKMGQVPSGATICLRVMLHILNLNKLFKKNNLTAVVSYNWLLLIATKEARSCVLASFYFYFFIFYFSINLQKSKRKESSLDNLNMLISN